MLQILNYEAVNPFKQILLCMWSTLNRDGAFISIPRTDVSNCPAVRPSTYSSKNPWSVQWEPVQDPWTTKGWQGKVPAPSLFNPSFMLCPLWYFYKDHNLVFCPFWYFYKDHNLVFWPFWYFYKDHNWYFDSSGIFTKTTIGILTLLVLLHGLLGNLLLRMCKSTLPLELTSLSCLYK